MTSHHSECPFSHLLDEPELVPGKLRDPGEVFGEVGPVVAVGDNHAGYPVVADLAAELAPVPQSQLVFYWRRRALRKKEINLGSGEEL